ncbi:hypothetical protein ABK040_016428 [Willaertia magna]
MEKKILTKATADSEDPTPGWMYHNIASMTKKSPQTCEEVVNWLLKRLSHKSLNVKKKVLLLIKSVAHQGDAEFARALVKRSEEIKQYSNFRGPKDDLHGDALNQAIRSAASQAMEAIFERSENRSNLANRFETASNNDNYAGHIGTYSGISNQDKSGEDDPYTQANSEDNRFNRPYGGGGIGSNNYKGGGIGSNSFAGIGSNSFGSNNNNIPTSERIGKMGGGGIYGPGAKTQQETKGYLDYVKNIIPFGGSNKNYGAELKEQYPEFINGEDYNKEGTYAPPSGVFTPPTFVNDTKPISKGSSRDLWKTDNTENIKGDSSGAYETKVVNDFTAVGGVRKATPTRMECSEFAQKCTSLNVELVAQLLDQKLDDNDWQVRLKALCGVEALIKANTPKIVEYFSENFENIAKQSDAVHESIRVEVDKILKHLNFNDEDDDPNNYESSPQLFIEDKKPTQTKKIAFTPPPSLQQDIFVPPNQNNQTNNGKKKVIVVKNNVNNSNNKKVNNNKNNNNTLLDFFDTPVNNNNTTNGTSGDLDDLFGQLTVHGQKSTPTKTMNGNYNNSNNTDDILKFFGNDSSTSTIQNNNNNYYNNSVNTLKTNNGFHNSSPNNTNSPTNFVNRQQPRNVNHNNNNSFKPIRDNSPSPKGFEFLDASHTSPEVNNDSFDFVRQAMKQK